MIGHSSRERLDKSIDCSPDHIPHSDSKERNVLYQTSNYEHLSSLSPLKKSRRAKHRSGKKSKGRYSNQPSHKIHFNASEIGSPAPPLELGALSPTHEPMRAPDPAPAAMTHSSAFFVPDKSSTRNMFATKAKENNSFYKGKLSPRGVLLVDLPPKGNGNSLRNSIDA